MEIENGIHEDDIDFPEDSLDSDSSSSGESESLDSTNENGEHASEEEEEQEAPGNLEWDENVAENEIDGDFQRLLHDIREDSGTGGSSINKIWDVSFRQDEAEFQDNIREASGIGKVKGSKGKRRRRRRGPPLSHEVLAIIGEANNAYVGGNLQEAIRFMMEVIRIEPRAESAWNLLATCYRSMGDKPKALQLSIIGAHLKHDSEEWYSLALESRNLDLNQQALYCYGKVASLDPSNVAVQWERASLAKEMGNMQIARSAYLGILKYFPRDINILTELRLILVEAEELSQCAQLYQNAFDYYTSKDGPTISQEYIDPTLLQDDENSPSSSNGEFTLMEILVLADLYVSLRAFEKVIKTVRAGCRWLQGRGRQKFWDACPDDREYDLEGWTRETGDTERLGAAGIKQGFYPLDVNARHRLGIARLKMGDLEEGRLQVNVVLSQSVFDFSPLFTEIADAYFENGVFAEARPIYELLGADETTSGIHILMRAATCRQSLGDIDDAAEVYKHIIEVDSSNNEARMELAKIYEARGSLRKALDLVNQVIDSRKRSATSGSSELNSEMTEVDTPNASLFSETRRKGKQKVASKSRTKMSKEDIIEMERQKESQAVASHTRLRDLWESTQQSDDVATGEWLSEAEKLIEMFRETRNLFGSKGAQPFRGMIAQRASRRSGNKEAQEDDMASRLELNIGEENKSRKFKADVDHYRGIHFNDWLILFVQYAFLVTKNGCYELAEEVLQHVLVSTVYQTRVMQDRLRLATIACAIRARRFPMVLDQCRKILVNHQFNNEPLRIMLAALASGLKPTDQFICNTLQKYLLREMRASDAAVKGNVQYSHINRRFVTRVTDENDEDEEPPDPEEGDREQQDKRAPPKPTKINPVLIAIHGQTMNASKAFQGSIFYLLHAFDLYPNDPLVLLSLCVASLGRAMQRQADNRNYLVTQAFGFLSRYRRLRIVTEDGEFTDEVEYNFGRAFHQIGLLSHATRHYERALQIADKRSKETNEIKGIAREAAYNLSLIYATTGAASLSRMIYRKWLTI